MECVPYPIIRYKSLNYDNIIPSPVPLVYQDIKPIYLLILVQRLSRNGVEPKLMGLGNVGKA